MTINNKKTPQVAPPRKQFQQPCPNLSGGINRIIKPKAPLYYLDQVQQLVIQNGIVYISDKKPDFDEQEMKAIIHALTDDDYLNSQWCQLTVGTVLDCDAYTVFFSRYNPKNY